MASIIDIRSLRTRFTNRFRAFDAAVEARNTPEAKAIRDGIVNSARAILGACEGTESAGIYTFADLDLTDLRGVHYVGQAGDRSILTRIGDRFLDNTCLDASLDGRPYEQAWRVAYRRLEVAYPPAGESTREKWAYKHMDTSSLFRDASHLFLLPKELSSNIIRAEKLLILAAAEGGAALIRRQKVEPTRRSDLEGLGPRPPLYR